MKSSAEFHALVAAAVRTLNHPEIVEVEETDSAVAAKISDGGTMYAKIAAVVPKGGRPPTDPTWPGQLRGEQTSGGRR